MGKLADAEKQVADAQENKRKKDEQQRQQQQQRSLDDADQKAKDTAKKTADQLRDDANHPDTTPKAKEGFDQIAAALDRVADGDPHKAAEILRSLPPEARDDQR